MSGIALILAIVISTIVLINKVSFESEKALKKQTTFYLSLAVAVGLLLIVIYLLK